MSIKVSRDSDLRDVSAVIGAIVSFIAAITGIALWRAWVLVQLWGWLVIPIFHLPVLRLVGAYTISLIAGFLTASLTAAKAEKDETTTHATIRGFVIAAILPALTLASGWVAHFFV